MSSEQIPMDAPAAIMAVALAQSLEGKMAYSIKDDAKGPAGSISTAYQRLHTLERLGLARLGRDAFEIMSGAVMQPLPMRKRLLPSLMALKNARRFGKYYTSSDVAFAEKRLPGRRLVTLDYAAWGMTGYQTPIEFCVYVEDMDESADYMLRHGFHGGRRGNIVLLPETGDLGNAIERVYLDCIAKGGRSLLDAIAIEWLHEQDIIHKARFSLDQVRKVQEDLEARN